MGMQTMGEYHISPPTVSDGAEDSIQLDSAANLKTTLATLIAGEDLTNNVLKVEQRFNYTYISTNATTVIKNAAGFLHNITVNGGSAGTIIIYDNPSTSGTIIASFDSTNALATYTLNVIATTGITIITSANTKVTVAWR